MTTVRADRLIEAEALAERGHTVRTASTLIGVSPTALRDLLKAEAPDVIARLATNSRSRKARRANAAAARTRLRGRLVEISPLRPHCNGREAEFTADDRPTMRAAAALCDGCPAFVECRDVAPHEAHGVWAGIVRSDAGDETQPPPHERKATT